MLKEDDLKITVESRKCSTPLVQEFSFSETCGLIKMAGLDSTHIIQAYTLFSTYTASS